MENTKIEWAHHTFNPWIGCAKVSDGCRFCYAEAFARRYNKAEWGPAAQRIRTSDAYWRKPLSWNRKAKQEGRRYRVFCASLADVFEDKAELDTWRHDLFLIIEQTQSLDWLLLTKRPENVATIIERHVPQGIANYFDLNPHVWIGASIENQEQANKRIPHLLEIPARVRFLSMEPLLDPVDLTPWVNSCPSCGAHRKDSLPNISCGYCEEQPRVRGLQWVIVGGESGAKARPMRESWVRSILNQCQVSATPFFFKQWGEWAPTDHSPTVTDVMNRVGKTAAGRQLNGRTWDETP